jgi:hypothetical protein
MYYIYYIYTLYIYCIHYILYTILLYTILYGFILYYFILSHDILYTGFKAATCRNMFFLERRTRWLAAAPPPKRPLAIRRKVLLSWSSNVSLSTVS